MPRISLRTYETEIEELIDHNHLQEAITNCRYILQIFPKNISTYRILGKAYLEGKQFSETSDVFTRVLTVFPDDFIAHVGMSIVRENEKNLNAAIWHMELAFDSQPSNIAIQDELKRLFGLRDGTHPEKIRLTRGALVRMYARGELYQQAIAEIKSALLEAPKRIDLEVLLAKMYYLSEDFTESLDLCGRLINELPFCYEINKTLVKLLSSSDNKEKIQIYADRLKALNPYEEFVDSNYLTVEQVPDEQVVLEKYSEVADASATSDSTLGNIFTTGWNEEEKITPTVSIHEPSEDILSSAKTDESPLESVKAVQPQNNQVYLEDSTMSDSNSNNNIAPNESDDTNIPNWMRNSGWIPSNGDNSGTAENPESISGQPVPEEALSADIPDWLKSLSPEEGQNISKTVDKDDSVEVPEKTSIDDLRSNSDWMNEMIDENTKPEENKETDLPDWLKNFEVDEKVEPVAKDDLPDWLNSLKSNDEISQEEVSPAVSNPFSEIPAEDSNSNPAFTSFPIPSEEVTDQLAENLDTPINGVNLPDTTSGLEDNLSTWTHAEIEEELPVQNEDVAPLTTENLSEESLTPVDEGVSAESTISKETGDDLLNWLRDLKPSDSLSEPGPDETQESVESPADADVQPFDFAAQLDRLQRLSDETEVPSSAIPEEKSETSEPDLQAESIIEPELTDESQVPIAEPVLSEQIEEPVLPVESIETKIEDQETEPSVEIAPVESEFTESALQNLEISIENGENLEQSIQELDLLSQEKPDDYFIWQLLGDAYAKSNDLRNALSSYNRAEEILIKSN